MAIPARPYGYRFDPKSKPTAAEVMACLQICFRLLRCNCPKEEIEQLPAGIKRHFEKSPM